MRNTLSKTEKHAVAEYLAAPVSAGLWQLLGEWAPEGVVAQIATAVEGEIRNRETVTIRSGKRDRKVRVDQEWRRRLKEVVSTVSFLLAVFENFDAQDDQKPEPTGPLGDIQDIVQLIFDMVDMTPFRAEWKSATAIFREKIRTSGFTALVGEGEPLRVASGFLIIQRSPRHHGHLNAIACTSEPLEDLREFLVAAGVVKDFTLTPIFAPEEELFRPYFLLLGLAYDAVVSQEHLQPLVQKALRNFAEESYVDCVGAIGLAAEDILTQVFETLFREQLTKGLTLGQLVDEIHNRAAVKFKKPEQQAPSLVGLFPEMKQAIEDPDVTPARAIELLRRVVSVLVDVQKHQQHRLDRIGRPDRRIAVWPDHVSYATTELIRYRNAAAHKSRVPIGPIECRRAAHSFIVLTAWWMRERTLTDWKRSSDEILRACVEKHSG